jgi:hypothetical protein
MRKISYKIMRCFYRRFKLKHSKYYYYYYINLLLFNIIEIFVLIMLGIIFSAIMEIFLIILGLATVRIFKNKYHLDNYVNCLIFSNMIILFLFICCNLFDFMLLYYLSGILFGLFMNTSYGYYFLKSFEKGIAFIKKVCYNIIKS